MIEYRINNDKYEMIDIDTGEVLDIIDEVAICYDLHPSDHNIKATLMKHGRKEIVETYYNSVRTILTNERGFNINIIIGKFDINELNKTISTTGYIYNLITNYQKDVK